MIDITGWQKGWAWCACFAELVVVTALKTHFPDLVPLARKTMVAGVQNTFRNASKSGFKTGVTCIQQGDVIFWRKKKNGKNTRFGHCGIVTRVYESHIWVVEGNSNSHGGREGVEVSLNAKRQKRYVKKK